MQKKSINMAKAKKTTAKADKLELARKLYLSGESLIKIAELLGMAQGTITNWCKNHGWEIQREKLSNIPGTDFEITMNIRKRILDLSKDASFDADEMGKLVSIKDKFLPKETDFDQFVKISSDLMVFAVKKDKGAFFEQFIKEFVEENYGYIDKKMKNG